MRINNEFLQLIAAARAYLGFDDTLIVVKIVHQSDTGNKKIAFV